MNQIPQTSFATPCVRLQENLTRVLGQLKEEDWRWVSPASPFEGLYLQSQELFRDVSMNAVARVYACELAQIILNLKNIKPIDDIFPMNVEFETIVRNIRETATALLNLNPLPSRDIPIQISDSDEHFMKLIQDRLGCVCRKLMGFLSPAAKELGHQDQPLTFETALALWSKIDLGLFEMSTSLTLIAQKDLFCQREYSAPGSGKVLWTEKVIQDLESAKKRNF